MLHLSVYVPEDSVEKVKTALFEAGAGKLGNYDQCSWQTSGMGQFRALKGSQPFVGEINQIELVREIKVEMLCDESVWPDVLQALRKSHPYETPAFYSFPVQIQ
ncbi:MAG: NGG1p interacting factor NIF3 [Bacteriovoracaceae bacterium]|nr:NGG1p interacting factor NIF3 [Bacteriovoracaceae bacterium]